MGFYIIFQFLFLQSGQLTPLRLRFFSLLKLDLYMTLGATLQGNWEVWNEKSPSEISWAKPLIFCYLSLTTNSEIWVSGIYLTPPSSSRPCSSSTEPSALYSASYLWGPSLIRLDTQGSKRLWEHIGLSSVCLCARINLCRPFICWHVWSCYLRGSSRVRMNRNISLWSDNLRLKHTTVAAFVFISFIYIFYLSPRKGSRCLRGAIKWKSMTGYNSRPREKDPLRSIFSVAVKALLEGLTTGQVFFVQYDRVSFWTHFLTSMLKFIRVATMSMSNHTTKCVEINLKANN